MGKEVEMTSQRQTKGEIKTKKSARDGERTMDSARGRRYRRKTKKVRGRGQVKREKRKG